jgi:hypothetical protein
MKKSINTLLVAFFTVIGLQAQTIYDAEKFMGDDLSGTARYVAMGGAMGALGGDISTISTNPAGIGIFRNSEAMITFGLNNLKAKSTYGRGAMTDSKFSLPVDNLGFVYSSRVDDNEYVRFINFGFNYHKRRNFNRSFGVRGMYGVSQTDQIAAMCSGREINNSYPHGIIEPSDLSSNKAFAYNDIPWLGALAYEANLMGVYQDNNNNQRELYKGYLADLAAPGIDGRFKSQEKGGIDQFDFNLAVNLKDALYLGLTIGAYAVDYSYESTYSENFLIDGADHGSYTFRNVLKTEGTGFDIKLGGIFRPIADNPLRIGFAIHTPTFYNLTDRNYAELSYRTKAYNETTHQYDPLKQGNTYTQDETGRAMDGNTDYKLITPWKFNLSAGYTLAGRIALGAEYQYADYSSAKLKYDTDGSSDDMVYENEMIGSMLKGVHTFKLGAEFKPATEFAVRMGYNVTSSSFKENAYKALPNNSIRTDTEYANLKAIHNFSFGLGYRTETFYGDITYQYSAYDADFYAFNNDTLPSSKLSYNRHHVMATLGIRF